MAAAFILVVALVPVHLGLATSGAGACSSDGTDAWDDDFAADEVALLQHGTELLTRKGGVAKLASVEAGSSSSRRALADPDASMAITPGLANYGDSGCQCIGFDDIPGETVLLINDTAVKYPANLGSRCAAWHLGYHLECLSDPMPEWCSQPFCYVDPCKCKSDSVPRLDPYMTAVTWQSKKVYYSYSACGGVDTFTPAQNPNACVNQKTQDECNQLSTCSWSLSEGCVGKALSGPECQLYRQNDQLVYGKWECPCIGMSGRNGTYKSLTLEANYPSSVGSTCAAWHDEVHPACRGAQPEKPSWCTQSWCYVDPCKCNGMGVVPMVDNVFPGGAVTGNSLFYSFATCGVQDEYTPSMNPTACSNQGTQEACETLEERCLWSFMGNQQGYRCRGIEVATSCVHTAFSKQQEQPTPKPGAASGATTSLLLLLLPLAATQLLF